MTGAPSHYYDAEIMRRRIFSKADGHRSAIGGMWDEIGDLQASFLLEQGLKSQHKFIDIGAGSFRAGVKIIPLLESGNYYAIDLSQDILDAGYSREIVGKMDSMFPKSNYYQNEEFDISKFGVKFNFGMAQSVFTHLPIEYLKKCLKSIENHFVQGGILYFTIFECPEHSNPAEAIVHTPGGRVTYADRDPYHYRRSDIERLADESWAFHWVGDWQHPRNQKMACFVRL